MTSYRRARAALAAAVVFAAVMIGTGFPLGTLLHQRSELAAAAGQLQRVRANNAVLQQEIASLSLRSTIVAIAREEYGLVRPGQQAIVVLPAPGDPAVGAGSLVDRPLPPADLVLTSPTAPTSAPVKGQKEPGLWSRVLSHLEFWRGLFS